VRRGAGIVTRAELLLALSDERDLHLKLRLEAWREGYAAGYRDAYARGYETAVIDWKITAGLEPGGRIAAARLRTYAEMDRKRYPPDGRASWLIIRGRRYRPGGRQSPIIPRDGAA
jgi:hypothetical protein